MDDRRKETAQAAEAIVKVAVSLPEAVPNAIDALLEIKSQSPSVCNSGVLTYNLAKRDDHSFQGTRRTGSLTFRYALVCNIHWSMVTAVIHALVQRALAGSGSPEAIVLLQEMVYAPSLLIATRLTAARAGALSYNITAAAAA
jgi:hypothetical protein